MTEIQELTLFFVLFVGIILSIMWKNLNNKIEHHEKLCEEDRKKLTKLETKLNEISCSTPMCFNRQPSSKEEIYGN